MFHNYGNKVTRITIFPDVADWGWSILDNKLVVKWDSEKNIQHIEKYRKLWTFGCHCKSSNNPCSSRNCGCNKSKKSCGPACKCNNKCCNKPADPSINALLKEDNTVIDLSGLDFHLVRHDYLTDEESVDLSESEDVS